MILGVKNDVKPKLFTLCFSTKVGRNFGLSNLQDYSQRVTHNPHQRMESCRGVC